jgi:hypothetical protein
MTQLQAVETKVMTDLTCWSCGEETLKEFAEAVDPHAFRAENAALGLMKSECAKCGVQSINARQALHNKIAARKGRKALIKAANSKSS